MQGDERDVIIISVGYGRRANGTMSMRFGPLGADGGERRLNVLISRAKRRCEVYASITDEDIDLERAKGTGRARLQAVPALRPHRTAVMARPEPPAATTACSRNRSARALQARGYQVHPQVGIAGFFIDLAIADPERPGRYLLGVECDGASYRTLALGPRPRPPAPAVLEDHGWTMHRIWSSDWFQRPEEQLRADRGRDRGRQVRVRARRRRAARRGAPFRSRS